ncbi:MAG: hypothetical protein LAT55_13620, partial [Opitutales bacterium]|nr:hypothetical protein [Opitutales bacterium]
MNPLHKQSLSAWNFFPAPELIKNDYVLVENYQNIPNGNIDYSLYTNLSGSTGMAAVAQDGDNKYVEFFPTNNDIHSFTNHTDIPD